MSEEHTKLVDEILAYKKVIDKYPDNDFFLFPFMSLVMRLYDSVGILSEDGLKILHNDIVADMKIVNEDPANPSQKALTRISLYLTTAYNLIMLYCGFIEVSLPSMTIPDFLREYLIAIGKRADKLYPTIEDLCKKHTLALSDKYARIFNGEKRKLFTKDIFDRVVHIPAHPNDLPEGFDVLKAKEALG